MTYFEGYPEPYEQAMAKDPEGLTQSIDQEVQRFDNILGTVLEECQYQRPHEGLLHILNVACGYCYEAPALANRFGPMQITGMDTNIGGIVVASNRSREVPGEHQFFLWDAAKELPAMIPKADIALIRRQNIMNNPPVWQNIFGRAMRRVAPNGLAIVTSLSDIEHTLMVGAFNDLGYQPDTRVTTLTPYHKNSFNESFPLGVMPIDHSVAVFQQHAA